MSGAGQQGDENCTSFRDNSANEGLIHSDFPLDVTNLTVGKDRALTGA